jgi:hypothetical protein
MEEVLRSLATAELDAPSVLLAGTVDYEMHKAFREQLDRAPAYRNHHLVGDPEVARMMGEDVRFHSKIELNRRRLSG